MSVEALRKKALRIVQDEQDQLAQAYQDQQRQRGFDYGYFDALDMVMGKATHDPKTFLESDLPTLRELAIKNGGPLFEVTVAGIKAWPTDSDEFGG